MQQWPIAKIVELITSRDGVMRVSRIKTSQGFLTRPLQRLFAFAMSTHEGTMLMNKRLNNGGDDLSIPNDVDHAKDNNQGLQSDVLDGDRQKLETSRYGREIQQPARFQE